MLLETEAFLERDRRSVCPEHVHASVWLSVCAASERARQRLVHMHADIWALAVHFNTAPADWSLSRPSAHSTGFATQRKTLWQLGSGL